MKKPLRKARKRGDDVWKSLHLTGKSDQDIMDWWDELEEGEGSRKVKAAIREMYLTPQGPSEIELLRREIQALTRMIQAGNLTPRPPLQDGEGEGQLDPAVAAARREQLRKAKW